MMRTMTMKRYGEASVLINGGETREVERIGHSTTAGANAKITRLTFPTLDRPYLARLAVL
eukprot:COSAG02_NODE_2825_length_7945_cov_79.964440_4_plen_60_part_00